MDSKRLSRALLLTATVFLLTGTAVGFAAADRGDATDERSTDRPGPGATAVYDVEPVRAYPDRAGPGPAAVDEVRLQWLEPRWVVDGDFHVRLAHPVQMTLLTPHARDPLVREALYDAGTGEPIFDSGYGANPNFYRSTLLSSDSQNFWYDEYDENPGMCLVRTALWDGVGEDDPLRVTGLCHYLGETNHERTYAPAGTEDTRHGRGWRYQATDEPLLDGVFVPGVPFPARMTVSLAQFIHMNTLDGWLYRLELREWLPAAAPYEVGPSLVSPGPGPIAPAPATDPVLPVDASGLSVPFPFEDAWRIALDPERGNPYSVVPREYDAFGSNPEGLRPFLESHPDAYLAYALLWNDVDDDGEQSHAWYLIVTDGTDWDALVVYETPADPNPYHDAGSLALGRIRFARDWEPSWLGSPSGGADGAFPPRDALPERLPRLSDIADRYAFLRPDEPTDHVWYSLACDGLCDGRAGHFLAGHQVRVSGTGVTPRMPTTASDVQNSLNVHPDGSPRSLVLRDTRYEPTIDVLAGAQEEPARSTLRAEAPTPAWTLPARSVAAGAGLLAILAGAAYYAWPALKSGLFAGLFSRIADETVLEHPTRARIRDAVTAEPGIHFQELARRVGVGRGNLQHHVRKLEDARILVSRTTEGRRCFFLRGTPREVRETAGVVRNPTRRSVLDLVRAEPGLTGRQVAARLGVSESTVSYHLAALRKAGLVGAGPDGVVAMPVGVGV